MTSDITALLEQTARCPPADPRLRKVIYNAAMDLMYELESAQDTAQRLYHGVSYHPQHTNCSAEFMQHLPLAMAQTGNDLGLFKTLCAPPGKEWSTEDLAIKTGADAILLRMYVHAATRHRC